jgi:hypothetical protein
MNSDRFANWAAMQQDVPVQMNACFGDLVNSLWDQGRFSEQESLLRQAIQLKPSDASYWFCLGQCLLAQQKAQEALIPIKTGCRLRPSRDGMHLLFMANLALENYREAYRCLDIQPRDPLLNMPLWAGDDLNDRSLLVHHEEGFGDTIQHARFLFEAAKRGGQIIFYTKKELRPLFENAPGLAGLFSPGDPSFKFDLQTNLFSLPCLLGLESVASQPYIKIPSVHQFPLPTKSERMRVAIAWAGAPTGPNDNWRSMKALDIEPLLRVKGVEVLSLPLPPVNQQLRALPTDLAISDLGALTKSFADTAAIMGQCDLVISTDCAQLHLAGALGVEAWGILCAMPDARWLFGREDSPWYPSIRLFRQKKLMDWRDVVARVATALTDRASSVAR